MKIKKMWKEYGCFPKAFTTSLAKRRSLNGWLRSEAQFPSICIVDGCKGPTSSMCLGWLVRNTDAGSSPHPLRTQSHHVEGWWRGRESKQKGHWHRFKMEGGQSEIEQKQQDQAVGANPSQLHTAGGAHPPEAQVHPPEKDSDTVVEWREPGVTPSFRGRSLLVSAKGCSTWFSCSFKFWLLFKIKILNDFGAFQLFINCKRKQKLVDYCICQSEIFFASFD